MKISIIMPAYNSQATIGCALNSIFLQSYTDIEVIVVDGNSNDLTNEIIRSYGKKITLHISEPDKGIYDALNKGLNHATGDIIGFLNTDDFYASSEVLSTIAVAFKDKRIDATYGDLRYVSRDHPMKTIRYWKAGNFKRGSFAFGWMPPHPTFFARKSAYAKHGNFNTKYQIASDVDMMMRLMEIHKLNVKYIPRMMVVMRMGGVSNSGIGNIFKQNFEISDSLNSRGIWCNVLILLFVKFFSRGKQYINSFGCEGGSYHEFK